MAQDQITLTSEQRKLWVTVVAGAQEEDRILVRKTFSKYIRLFPKTVGLALLYAHLTAEKMLLENNGSDITTDIEKLSRVCTIVSERVSPLSPPLTPVEVDRLLRISLGLDEHNPSSTSNELLLMLVIVSALVPEGKSEIYRILGEVEAQVEVEMAEESSE